MANNAASLPEGGGNATVRDRVEELTWALVDEQISDDEFRLLDSLMLSDDAARDTYLGCIQLHADLMFHFAKKEAPPAGSGKTPVLGFLGENLPPAGSQPQLGEHN